PLELEQVALEIVDPHGGVAAGVVPEDVGLQGLEVVLQRVHDEKVLVDHEIHDRMQHEARPLGQEMRGGLAAGAHVGVGQRGPVADRDHVASPHEEVGLPERDPALLAVGLGGAQGDEERVAVALELGPLVGQVGILDGEIVQAELGLDLPQQRLVRLVESDPYEAVVEGEDVADVLDLDVGDQRAARVGRARHHRSAAGGSRHQATVTATQVVVRVTPSMIPMESVTRLPIASSDWPSTMAMKSKGPVTASMADTVARALLILASAFLTFLVLPAAVSIST